MPDANVPPPTPPKRRLTIFYVVLAITTAIVVAVVLAAGDGEDPQPAIAGGYDVTGAAAKCLGPQFDVQQSGQYVNLTNAKEDLGGKLTFDSPELTGDVDCVDGGGQEMDAKVADGFIRGTLGAAPVEAELKRDPPDPGGQRPRAPSSVSGLYKVSPRSSCIGGRFELEKAGGDDYELTGTGISGELKYADGVLAGTVTCKSGDEWNATGQAVDRNINNLILSPADAPTPDVPGAVPAGGEKVTATKGRESFGESIAVFLLAVAVVMLFARLLGELAVRIRQPRVMGEVVAGLLLGPTLFGWLLPDLQSTVFASDILPTIGLVANLGLIFYIFLVGLELDVSQLRGRAAQATAISNASVALPMMLGIAVALPLYVLVGPDKKFVAFAIYMGVAMSITAFPVLARILVERRMLKRPLGALTMTCAAIDDITAWFLIALATAVAASSTGFDVVKTIAWAIVFCLGMVFLVRPLISRVSTAYDEAGKVPGAWVVAIFAGVLLSAYVTEQIGIAVIFGAFMMGAVMPRNAGLTEDVTHRVEDFVVVLLLPLFFAYTGLRMNIGLLDRPELWLITLLLIVIAIVGKWVGAMAAARLTGFDWRASNVVGALMNTRGLTELIVLNLALDAGVISQALFAMLVIMALVTTFMAGPALNLLDPTNSYGESLDTELEIARETSRAELPTIVVPERAIIVAPQTDEALPPLRALAEPLARSEPPRELILARLVAPPRAADAGVRAGISSEERLIEVSEQELKAAQHELADEAIASRAVAFVSPQPGRDLVELAESEEVDLVLLDGSRPLLGGGIPKGEVGYVLEHAPTDVAVLVAREGAAITELGKPVVVPFGGQEHDWAALELAAWMASSTGAELRLLGAAGQTEDQTKVKRVLDDASLLVRQFAPVEPEPVIADSGGLLEAASGAGLLVVGLSQRWRREGLGQVRSELARAGVAPILFVRRGERPGALAPRSDVTRFAWSSVGMGGGGGLTPSGPS